MFSNKNNINKISKLKKNIYLLIKINKNINIL